MARARRPSEKITLDLRTAPLTIALIVRTVRYAQHLRRHQVSGPAIAHVLDAEMPIALWNNGRDTGEVALTPVIRDAVAAYVGHDEIDVAWCFLDNDGDAHAFRMSENAVPEPQQFTVPETTATASQPDPPTPLTRAEAADSSAPPPEATSDARRRAGPAPRWRCRPAALRRPL